MRIVEFPPEPVDPERVLVNLGYRDSSPSAEISDLIDRSLEEALEFGETKGAYALAPITERDTGGLSTGSGSIRSARFSAISNDARDIAYGLVTAGQILDEKADGSTNLMEACIWDAVGTVITERAVDRLLDFIGAETGTNLSMPFSPGYCDWELSGQAVIFDAVDPSKLGIDYLPDTFVMSPRKSVSFVACTGSGPMERNPCKYCNMKQCFMRRR